MLSAELTDAILTPKVRWGRQGEYERWMGYGFEFRVDPAGGENRIACMMKDGVNTGVICRLHDYPSTNSLVAILANQECPSYQIVQDIEKLLF